MFTPPPRDSIFEMIEHSLARLTGRGQWPSTEAVLELETEMPSDTGGRFDYPSRFEIFTYEVEGNPYAATVRKTTGYKGPRIGSTVQMQYNPRNPADFYYLPACKLANRLIAGIVIVAGILAILVCIRTVGS